MDNSGLLQMAKIRQKFLPTSIGDIAAAIGDEFKHAQVNNVIKAGQSVAVTIGSRGISNNFSIMKALVEELVSIGAKPFIVPSMGSHGGATAEGQRALLATFGITEETMEVEIRSSMEVVQVGVTPDNIPVVIDRYAHEADHIFIANRIKPHTDFEGNYESGLMKMIAIGLGKQKGADAYHNRFMQLGHVRVITDIAELILAQCNIPFALAIVENQVDETAILEIVSAEDIVTREKLLLKEAKSFLPRLPFKQIDLLIVDEIGKHYSGTGMDQNVIARTVIPYHVVPDSPSITRIFVRDIDKNSGGNGLGIGNADFTTSRFVEKYNRPVSYMNSITAACPEITRIPNYLDTDRQVIETAYKTLPLENQADCRVVWIKNTLHLEEMYISESMLEEAKANDMLEVVRPVVAVNYDGSDNLQYPNV